MLEALDKLQIWFSELAYSPLVALIKLLNSWFKLALGDYLWIIPTSFALMFAFLMKSYYDAGRKPGWVFFILFMVLCFTTLRWLGLGD